VAVAVVGTTETRRETMSVSRIWIANLMNIDKAERKTTAPCLEFFHIAAFHVSVEFATLLNFCCTHGRTIFFGLLADFF